jgi:anti-sigma factor RsiW
MECAEIEARLSALVDGELEQTHDIERHLAACESCRRKRALLVAVQSAVRRLPAETVSNRFTAALERRLDAERQPLRGRRGRWLPRSVVLVGALAAALVLGLWTSTHLRSRVPPPSPPPGDVATLERWPGLDCGLEIREPRGYEQHPCAAADSCGLMGVPAAALTLAFSPGPACVTLRNPG